jgi:hypothetical protein
MMFPHILDSEQRDTKPRPDRTVGLKMRVDGRWYFFPGSVPADAGYLAELALGREAIEADSTRVEWGTAASGTWVCEKVLKVSVGEDTAEKELREEQDKGWG